MVRFVFAAFVFVSSASFAASPADIHRTLDDIHYAIDHQTVSPQDVATIQNSLQSILDLIYQRPLSNSLVCAKNSNGLFYPSQRTGEMVGDSSYSAGFSQLGDCRATLPKVAGGVTCFKRSNGLYYPTNSATGAIIGSTAYSAGYSALADCLTSVQ